MVGTQRKDEIVNVMFAYYLKVKNLKFAPVLLGMLVIFTYNKTILMLVFGFIEILELWKDALV